MGWLLLDRYRSTARTVRATAALVGILVAPGAVLVAWAWGLRRKEWNG